MNVFVSPIGASSPAIGFPWLLRLRWGAAAGQLLMIGLAMYVFGLPLTVRPLLALVTVTVVTNGALHVALARRVVFPRLLVAAVLMLDACVLTAMLFLSGGSSNPFSVFYLVHVALAALLLDAISTWILAALTSASFGALFLKHAALGPACALHAPDTFSRHLQGMWLAYTLSAFFVAYFVSKIARALQRQERHVAELERQAARSEKLASLSTLAAGAAHELGTPLATIALAAHELARRLEPLSADPDLLDDAHLIRDQVARCRSILDQLRAPAGESAGEAPVRLGVGEVLRQLVTSLGSTAAQLRVLTPEPELTVEAPPRALVEVLTNLVRNGLDAQQDAGRPEPISLRVALQGANVAFVVRDTGRGMTTELLARIGEPFFTTKATGKGLGLGLFLAHRFAESLTGRLEVHSLPGQGTETWLMLPQRLWALSPRRS